MWNRSFIERRPIEGLILAYFGDRRSVTDLVADVLIQIQVWENSTVRRAALGSSLPSFSALPDPHPLTYLRVHTTPLCLPYFPYLALYMGSS